MKHLQGAAVTLQDTGSFISTQVKEQTDSAFLKSFYILQPHCYTSLEVRGIAMPEHKLVLKRFAARPFQVGFAAFHGVTAIRAAGNKFMSRQFGDRAAVASYHACLCISDQE